MGGMPLCALGRKVSKWLATEVPKDSRRPEKAPHPGAAWEASWRRGSVSRRGGWGGETEVAAHADRGAEASWAPHGWRVCPALHLGFIWNKMLRKILMVLIIDFH